MKQREVMTMKSIKRACGHLGCVALTALTATACDGWPGLGLGDDCQQETITTPPEWECSGEVLAQLAEDRAVLTGSSRSDIPGTLQSSLVAHDSCASGVESTRVAVSLASDLQLRGARMQLLSARCEPRTEYRSRGSCVYDTAQPAIPGVNNGAVTPVADQAAGGGASE